MYVYVYIYIFLNSSVDGLVVCFHTLAIVNHATITCEYRYLFDLVSCPLISLSIFFISLKNGGHNLLKRFQELRTEV